MRFVLNGVNHELHYEDVVAAARRVTPDGVDGRNKYYVVIEDQRLLVRRLFAEATGLKPDEFKVYDAMRNLRKLGFEVLKYSLWAGESRRYPSLLSSDDTGAQPERKDSSKTRPQAFAVSLETDEDGFIVASCPQLPGCHSQGRSREEAIRNIEEAIRGYVASMKQHGEEIPEVDWALVEVAL